MTNAGKFGFSPAATASENVMALQQALDCGGIVQVTEPGCYDLNGVVLIGSDTTLECLPGVVLRRCNAVGYTLMNKGALSRTYDCNIRLIGVQLSVNGCDVREQAVPGMNAHIGFHFVKNLEIRHFVCRDLTARGFCIQVCTFEHILLEDLEIEGRKDAVHLGYGRDFIIRRGRFRTFDDPIALNAHDYIASNPQFGWIEDGVIEDCCDLDQPETTGFFCRLLGGAWGDWFPGMAVRRSDLVMVDGKLYSAGLPVDGKERISTVAPAHLRGVVTVDGIAWRFIQSCDFYHCGVRNVLFRNITLAKRRDRAFSLTFDNDRYSRSVYPGAVMPVLSDITWENISVRNQVKVLLEIRTPCDRLMIRDSSLGHSGILLNAWDYLVGRYPVAHLSICNVTYAGDGLSVLAENGRSVKLSCCGMKSGTDEAVR